VLGEPRHKSGDIGDSFFLGHYYEHDLYYEKKTDMLHVYNADYTGSSCKPFLIKKVNNPKDSHYPLKKALDLSIKFKLRPKKI
jgi:hypothetical protein